MIINHHYCALRITELAAGTDVHRDPQTTSAQGTSPTPCTASTPAKSRMDDVKSLARRNNRMQREEIMMAQDFLRKWYDVTHQPQLDEEGRSMIYALERAPAGPQFDRKFLEVFSRHHYMALTPSMTCVVASDIRHEELQGYCRGMVQAQLADIEEMRHMLAATFNIADYQPIRGVRGLHTGSEREGAH
ncbi:DUF305 domain-containing protein [Massilia eurypsychrophila]|uniref:DUF305 domain-containing protein n=1 Tax=Massilia eurypsychrophila TaxID=1485217 RepID=A0A2G8T7W8_9BURK|nr:DUF305 domain-containing protein [Massilia eurypsychrophila]PIL42063.1 DUF305 domain-containing protein [Massilia eurypsychrophila]